MEEYTYFGSERVEGVCAIMLSCKYCKQKKDNLIKTPGNTCNIVAKGRGFLYRSKTTVMYTLNITTFIQILDKTLYMLDTF